MIPINPTLNASDAEKKGIFSKGVRKKGEVIVLALRSRVWTEKKIRTEKKKEVLADLDPDPDLTANQMILQDPIQIRKGRMKEIFKNEKE